MSKHKGANGGLYRQVEEITPRQETTRKPGVLPMGWLEAAVSIFAMRQDVVLEMLYKYGGDPGTPQYIIDGCIAPLDETLERVIDSYINPVTNRKEAMEKFEEILVKTRAASGVKFLLRKQMLKMFEPAPGRNKDDIDLGPVKNWYQYHPALRKSVIAKTVETIYG